MLFTNDADFFYINFEKWNNRFIQDAHINSFNLTGRTQYKNMNNNKVKKGNRANFVSTYFELMEYIQEKDKEKKTENYNLVMNYFYSAKVYLDKAISNFTVSDKLAEDYETYEEELYKIFERLLVVKNSAGINLRSTIVKLLREMITEKYKEYGDNLKTPNVVNPELYVSDELMIDLYIFGYIQRLLIPFVSHWIDTFKDKRDKVDSDDPLNVVLTRIWTYVLDLTFSKTRKERIENKIQKKITAVVTLREMRNPQFFKLWSRQGFDKNNMMLMAYEDFMFKALFKIVLSPNERSKGLGFIDGVINNRVNLIFGDRIKEGESIQVILENKGSGDNRRRIDSETSHYDEDSEYEYIDRGIDEFRADDRVESLFRLDDGIFDSLRSETINQVLYSNGKHSLKQKLGITDEDLEGYEQHNYSRTRLHTYVMNIVLGSVMDLSLLQSGIKSREYEQSMIFIYSYLKKHKYHTLLEVLENSDLSEVTKFISNSKTEQLSMNIKETQLHRIIKQLYSEQLTFSDKDRVFDYVIRICGSVGENQLKRYISDVEEKVKEERISLIDLAKDLMKLIISFSS